MKGKINCIEIFPGNDRSNIEMPQQYVDNQWKKRRIQSGQSQSNYRAVFSILDRSPKKLGCKMTKRLSASFPASLICMSLRKTKIGQLKCMRKIASKSKIQYFWRGRYSEVSLMSVLGWVNSNAWYNENIVQIRMTHHSNPPPETRSYIP